MSGFDAAAGYHGKTVLVTGASGYIGTAILRLLRRVDCQVRALVIPDEVTAATPLLEAIGPAGLRVAGCDLRVEEDFEPLLDGVDVVFHLAAQTSHYEANAKPREDFASSVAPLLRLLEACRRVARAPRIVFASSATVVGLPKTLPVDEQAPCLPVTVYDVHKLCGEGYLHFFSVAHGVPTCALRLANVYGRGRAATRPDRGIMNMMTTRALAGEDLTVYGSGNWLRDYVHLSDVARAFLHGGVAPAEAVSGKAFNVCTGVGSRFRDVLESIVAEAEAISGKRSRIVHVDKTLSPIDERSYVGSHAAFTAASGWSPRVELRDGIAELVRASVS
jgi:nucleoside-diphosphate-sugar epimerase